MTAWRPELWLAVIALGAYHGLNPGMGWPLAVSNGMWAKRDQAVFATFLPLAGGIVAAFGVYKLLDRRHPRIAARLGPKHLTLWSFLTATAHGAGLMLAPIALGLCASGSEAAPSPALGRGHEAMSELMRSGIATSIAVSGVHTIAMVAAGGAMAWIVYRWAGLKLLRSAWINLESVWAASLILTGLVSVAL
jgi:hypothetical protein